MKLLSHPGAGWHIRAAKPLDRDDIERIFKSCLEAFPWRGSIEDELIRLRKTAAMARFFVAEEPNAGVVGFLTLETPKAYVPHLFVDLDWRFCGVGQGLLVVAREEAGRPLTLDVDSKNETARAAYEALGWTELADANKQDQRGDQIRLVSQ